MDEPASHTGALAPFAAALAEWILAEKPGRARLQKMKRRLCRDMHIAGVPSDAAILQKIEEPAREAVRRHLRTNAVRALSGVYVVSVATPPRGCPHGKCTFCPGGPGSPFGDVPQSYTGSEPSIARSRDTGYDAYKTVMHRLAMYVMSGHVPEKIELILQGATFPAYPEEEQRRIVRNCYWALNDFSKICYQDGRFDGPRFHSFFQLSPEAGIHPALAGRLDELRNRGDAIPFETVRDDNEVSAVRCVGLTIETKPDHGFLTHGRKLLELGCTRIELGVQTDREDILKQTHRGHTFADTVRSARELRDLGYKLNFHVMPGLPGSTREDDIRFLHRLFTDTDLRPDMLKIYPCMVMKGTPLYEQWKRGEFAPVSSAEAAERIAAAAAATPEYCRVMRIQRDIPVTNREAGVEHNNLREHVDELLLRKGIRCRCIRCRESGARPSPENMSIRCTEYRAAGGHEFFIQAEAGGRISGFLRMRFPSTVVDPVRGAAPALIREMHIYGESLQIGGQGGIQHSGIGTRLLQKAETVARARGRDRMVIISAVGVRGYFRKRGYESDGPYMSRSIDASVNY